MHAEFHMHINPSAFINYVPFKNRYDARYNGLYNSQQKMKERMVLSRKENGHRNTQTAKWPMHKDFFFS